MYDRNYLEDLKQRVDLRHILGEEKIRCPWHDDEIPSLMPYRDHSHCYACSKTADSIETLQAVLKYTFQEAVIEMERHKGGLVESIDIPLEEIPTSQIRKKTAALLDNADALLYLEKRGITKQTIKGLFLGWDGNIAIPHFVNGKVENIKWRMFDNSSQKYTSMKHRKFNYLYPWDYFRRYFSQSPVLFITEGEFDAMILLQEGIPALSVPSGANTPLDKWVGWLKRFKWIIILYDMDRGGEDAVKAMTTQVRGKPSIVENLYPTKVFRHVWDSSLGKDVTEAREQLLPEILDMYMKIKFDKRTGD